MENSEQGYNGYIFNYKTERPTLYCLNNPRNLLAYETEKSSGVGFRHGSIRDLDPLCFSSLSSVLFSVLTLSSY